MSYRQSGIFLRRDRRRLGGGYASAVMGSGPIAYWPLDEGNGTVAHCRVDSAQNGTATGVTWANDSTGPFSTPAPYFDGANDYVNIYSAALDAAFDEDEGSVLIWWRVANAGVWTDGLVRNVVCLSWGGFTEYSKIDKIALANTYQLNHRTNGANHARNITKSDTGWMCTILTWSAAANQTRFFDDGVEDLPAVACAAAVAAGLDNDRTLLGARLTTPLDPYHGWLAHCAIWDRPLTPAEVLALANP